MEFTPEFIADNKFEETQIEAIKKHIESEVVPNLKKEYEGLANTNAEGILTGVSKSVLEKNGLAIEREKGEKWADYIERLSEAKFTKEKESLVTRQKEIDDKLKNFKGSDDLKQALEAEKTKNDNLLKQVAELEPLKGLDIKIKEKDQELSGLKLNVAFNSVKPSFPENANKYEADAKWNEFKDGVLEKYNIELVDGKPIAVDKENPHKQVKLSDLLEQDKNITDLLQGRKQEGTGGKPASLKDVEGVPFRVPQNATTEELSLIVREHLEKKLGDRLHPDFASQFQDLLTKIRKSA
jgi:hypothetical protein